MKTNLLYILPNTHRIDKLFLPSEVAFIIKNNIQKYMNMKEIEKYLLDIALMILKAVCHATDKSSLRLRAKDGN